jgi:hypothetical protein
MDHFIINICFSREEEKRGNIKMPGSTELPGEEKLFLNF